VKAENVCMILILPEAIEGSGFGTCRPNSVMEFPDDGGRTIWFYLLLPFRLNIKEIFISQTAILSEFNTPTL